MERLLMAIITWNAEGGAAVDGDYYLECWRWSGCWWRLLLEMLKKHLYVITRLSCGQSSLFNNMGLVATQQILLPTISMKMSLVISEGNWSPNCCNLNLLDHASWAVMKKVLYNNAKSYEDIEGLSAAVSDAWDSLAKKIIIQSINGGCN